MEIYNKTLYKKLLAVQSELKCNKSQYNSFGKYHYRNAEDILEAVKPLLVNVKATVIISDEIVNIANRFYVKAKAIFIDIESGEHTEVVAYAREPENKKGLDESQITGSTSSYARKYALNGLLLIDDNKDSDYAPEHKNSSSNKISQETKDNLNKLIQKYSDKSKKKIKDIVKELSAKLGKNISTINEIEGKILLQHLNRIINKTNDWRYSYEYRHFTLFIYYFKFV